MTRRKLLVLALVACVAFSIGQGATVKAFHGVNYGYFNEQREGGGWWNVWPAWGGSGSCPGDGWAIPGWVGDADSFINFVACKINTGSTQEVIGGLFLVHTMTGSSSYDFNEFAARVRAAEARGWINFYANVGCDPSNPPRNTFYQSTRHDVAWYWGCPINGSGAITTDAITFFNGSDTYILMRYCANPLGNMPALADDPSFNMSGHTAIENRTSAARGTNPFPGDTVRFRHYVRNDGPGSTWPFTTIWWAAERMAPLPAAGVGGSADGGWYGPGEEKNVYNHDVTIPAGTIPGTQFCERVAYDPVNGFGVRDGRGAQACATVAYNYNLTPTINAAITGIDGAVTGSVAEPGDTIRFTYAVNNTGTTVSQNVSCTYRRAQYAGYSTAPPSTVFTPAGANCPPNRTFPFGANTTTATEISVPANPVNTSICRSFTISPVTTSGGSRTTQACVQVASKPYARAYGGDLSAGGGVTDGTGSCTLNAGAAIIGWNRRAAGSWAGAGVQFAAYAMSTIFDTATILGNAAPTVAPPSGLAFTNTPTNTANGLFGGRFGTTECIKDYYSTMPASAAGVSSGVNVSSLGSGSYQGSGNFRIAGGNVNPNQKTTLYIDGNALIEGNITYAGTWSAGRVPLFRLVVRGNIFVRNNVTRLDGLYVAQQSNSSNGIIYTCAAGGNPFTPLPLAGSLLTTCGSKLTVNGAVVGSQIRLMRASGTLRASSAAETASGGNMAEAFNYGPGLWIAQPVDSSEGLEVYDAITSLPPVL